MVCGSLKVCCVEIQMEYEGIRFISNCVLFDTMKGLVDLNIAKNRIESKGFVILVKSIERGGFPNLQHLDVSGCVLNGYWYIENGITDDGVNYLLVALSKGRLGVLIQIDMACLGFGVCLCVANKISKTMIETCNQALSGQDELRVSFAVNQVYYFVCWIQLIWDLAFVGDVFVESKCSL